MSVNRTACSVLNEMRKCSKTRNFSYLSGLIEELQSMVNAMEAALYDKHDLQLARKKYKKMRQKIKDLAKTNPEVEDMVDRYTL